MDAREGGSRGVVDRWRWKWLASEGLLGGKYRTFSPFRNPHAAKLQRTLAVWGPIGTTKPQNWGRGQRDPKPTARPATCLLVLPLLLRMSLSFNFLAAWEHDGAPPGHLCAFCASVLWFGRAARFVCAHSYVNVKTPVLVWALFRGFSWFFPSRSPLRLPLQRRHLCAISHTSMR